MYSYSLDKVIQDLNCHGFAKLPSIQSLVEKNNYFEIFKNEGQYKTYKENSAAHLKLIDDMDLKKLFVALYNHGKELGLRIDKMDQYFISRYITKGQISEGYRGHFDSHFITIVLPVLIPQDGSQYNCGELLAVPNFRGHISSEIINILQKAYFKKLNSEEAYRELINKGKGITLNFRDYEPFVFYGNRTFHGNFPLTNSTSNRLTFLCHLYDTSPRYGIGALLRKVRSR
jgi:hypothetical protein